MSRINSALKVAVEKLLAERHSDGHWEGRLSSSALSTATALSALAINADRRNANNGAAPPGPAEPRMEPEDTRQSDAEGIMDSCQVSPPPAPRSPSEPSPEGAAQEARLSSPEAPKDTRSLNNVASLRTAEAPNATGDAALIAAGLRWLTQTQCEDGGWGDTPDSPSNLSTTLLVLSSMTFCRAPHSTCLDRANAHVQAKTGGRIAETIAAHYGKDRTFAVPILMNCALAGLVPWSDVPSLPFELAVVPPRLYRLIKLQVVSYALPALIAVGLVIHVKKGSRHLLRKAARRTALRRLEKLQPSHGGFLDATPLTSFVAMSLAGAEGIIPLRDPQGHGRGRRVSGPPAGALAKAGASTDEGSEDSAAPGTFDSLQDAHGAVDAEVPRVPRMGPPSPRPPSSTEQEEGGVLAKALSFIRRSVREDGSWPIDTDLAAWVTSSAANALMRCDVGQRIDWGRTLAWLKGRQTQAVHPFTHAAPGGWPWTDQEGGVPDGDDTSGAILALSALEGPSDATARGAQWLIDLQNADGGWPTFCRGWGRLPFDQSSPDITAHAIRALRASEHPGADRSIANGLRYLEASQRPDGSWVPLWFGSQLTADHASPVLGTSRALMAFGESGDRLETPVPRAAPAGARYLLAAQNSDGSWGADKGIAGTVEETSLALTALTHCAQFIDDEPELDAAWRKGADRLAEWVEAGALDSPAPIGLYFASLWYSERLYPVIWAVEALGRAVELAGRQREATTD